MKYWQVIVQFERENDRGRVQKIKENYLVDAMSGTEAETKMYKHFEARGDRDFSIISLSQSRVVDIVE